ncbi:hypothetical protein [Streptomyces sp. DSM 40750]|uniref:hypothetical protein n=1 Tax=Streptomyces sp. DSM 40750 TaxID=2801030 RepID=UPI00214AA9C6|nr:hypothetical protein [Streptomyces sp. DSM 40750]UUU23593.1 hypothetical protein JIX55_26890 [Streptomyces sp. DSM 40750]
MAAGTTDSPATLYGPVSLGLGVIALISAFFFGIFGILAGALAITFGVLGLTSRINRTKSTIGLVTGAFGFLYPLSLIFVFAGGF